MGAFDIFEIVATGKGAHAAMAYTGKDPMLFVAHAISALQTIVSRNLHPLDAGVVSVTQVHGGDTWNVIPQEVVLRGTVRSFRPEVQDMIEQRMRTIVAGIAATFEMTASIRYERRYPATVNDEAETKHALAAAAAVVGAGNVDTDPVPNMGSEDFAFMLQAKPGCYVWLGAGRGPDTPNVHNPHYDFNDDTLAIGASDWVALAEQQLSGRKAETWMAVGSAILSNIGLLTGGRRRINLSGASSALSRNRMENATEAKVEALKAEVAELDQKVTELMVVDSVRFEERTLEPSRSDVSILRYDVVWIY
jgi:hypothetical protein